MLYILFAVVVLSMLICAAEVKHRRKLNRLSRDWAGLNRHHNRVESDQQ